MSAGRAATPPIARGRAAAILAGMFAFTLGFAVAGGFVLAQHGGTPPYLIAVTIGFAGVGLTGVALGRGPILELPRPIWGPEALRIIAAALDLPAMPVLAGLYVLAGLGIAGNIVTPLLRG